MSLDNVFLTLFLYPVSNAIRFLSENSSAVEHNLAKVGVASSILVFRSKSKSLKSFLHRRLFCFHGEGFRGSEMDGFFQ